MKTTMFLPLPGGQLVPLDAMGQPDFSRMIAGTETETPAASKAGPVLVVSNPPTFRTGTAAIDPKWLILGVFALALLLASDR